MRATRPALCRCLQATGQRPYCSSCGSSPPRASPLDSALLGSYPAQVSQIASPSYAALEGDGLQTPRSCPPKLEWQPPSTLPETRASRPRARCGSRCCRCTRLSSRPSRLRRRGLQPPKPAALYVLSPAPWRRHPSSPLSAGRGASTLCGDSLLTVWRLEACSGATSSCTGCQATPGRPTVPQSPRR